MLIKNEHYEMRIDDCGNKGEGIGKVNNFTVFVEGVVVGDFIEVRIIKVNKSFAFGKLIRVIEKSESRVQPRCPVHIRCGGCTLQQVSYETQLKLKTKRVYDALTRIGGLKDITVENTIGMDNPYHYRNKAQFPVAEVGGEAIVGFYSARSHTIVPIDECAIQHPVNEQIIRHVKAFMKEYGVRAYDEEKHVGLIRHILTKVGFATNEIMVCLIINGNQLPHAESLVERLRTIDGMASIVINKNTKRTNVILGEGTDVLWGKSYITESIGDIKFEISAPSFFQVNPVQTKILYEKALEFAGVAETDTVIDAYCGIGSVSLFFAQKAKKVIGIEMIADAVEDAKRNAALNGIDNVEFHLGTVEEVLPQICEGSVHADIIIVDPPRKGLEPELIQTLLQIGAGKIVYISCDPATLARDLKMLVEGGYTVGKAQPVDMFPMGMHVETVVLMQRVENI